MPRTLTLFDTTRPHIHLEIFVITPAGQKHTLDAILDTGAPRSEFSDQFLIYAGLIKNIPSEVPVKPNLQTQKYTKVLLPQVEICSQKIENLEVFSSRFEKTWGIDALIGLDFFRRFQVSIDYTKGGITVE